MVVRVGINGFGRIGRLVLRAGWKIPGIKFSHINEIKGGTRCAAHLLEFDSIHGQFNHKIYHSKNKVMIDEVEVAFSEFSNPAEVGWKSANLFA